METNPFETQWRECLRAHYTHVIRVQDVGTERTLSKILKRLNFTDAELAELRVLATIRTEDMGEDFVPDMAALGEVIAGRVEAELAVMEAAAEAESVPPAAEVIAETTLVAGVTLAEAPAADAEPPVPPAPPPQDEYYAPADDSPRQMSLF
jgi:hypothetical protein